MKTKFTSVLIILIMISSTQLLGQRNLWQQQELPASVYALYGVHFVDADQGWAVGLESFNGPATILHSNNGGENWVKQNTDALWALNDVFFFDQSKGWIVGEYGEILHTADGGTNWEAQSSGISDSHHLDGVFFVNETTGWAVGNGWTGVPGIIIKTTDGGNTWAQQATGLSGTVFLLSVHFIDEETGWAVGTSGVILKTTDAGANWVQQTVNTDETLTSVSFVDASNGWVVGYEGLILHTNDGGQNWSQQSSGHDGYIDGVFFASTAHGWAVGSGGTIMHTTNGGTNWGTTNVGSFLTRLYDVHFVGGTKGWTAGAASSSGRMFHYNEGATGITTDAVRPKVVAYPNPFATEVAFDFAPEHSTAVQLQIFDAKGTMVHEAAYTAGLHGINQLKFNGTNHPAGIYHYQLLVDNKVYSGKLQIIHNR